MALQRNIQLAVNAIIRPPRMGYNIAGMPLFLDAGDDGVFIRHPVRFENDRHQQIVGSLYHNQRVHPLDGGPVVMYLHGNASCQVEGQFLVPNFCPHNVFVFCFDFVGCGCSDGKYVSLGYFEQQDTECLIRHLHEVYGLGPFVLWGRSMGAATTLLVDYPELVVGKISDSAFTSIPDEIAGIAKFMKLPGAFVPAAVWYLKRKVLKIAEFNMSTVSPLKAVQQIDCPTVFGHAEDDQFVPFSHLRRLYDASLNPEKFLMVLEGGHNDKRDENWLRLGVSFALERFNIKVKDLQISEARMLQEKIMHFDSFVSLCDNTRVKKEGKDVLGEFEHAEDKESVQVSVNEPEIVTPQEKSPEKKKRKKKHRKVDVETQTLALFALPPLEESAKAPAPIEESDKEASEGPCSTPEETVKEEELVSKREETMKEEELPSKQDGGLRSDAGEDEDVPRQCRDVVESNNEELIETSQ